MHFENLEAIVDFAIEKEREAAEFYDNISQNEEDFSGSKKMFAEFAVEEQKHEKILQEFKTKGIAKSLEDYKFKWITDIKRSDYLVDLEYEEGMPYNEILLLAMKREEKALKLYNQFLEQADTEEALEHVRSALDLAKQALDLSPGDEAYLGEYGKTLRWAADAHMRVCDIGSGFEYRLKAVELAADAGSVG